PLRGHPTGVMVIMATFFTERRSQNAQIDPGQHLDLAVPVVNPGTILLDSIAMTFVQPRHPTDPSDPGPEPETVNVAQRLELFKPGATTPVASVDDPTGSLPSVDLPFTVAAVDAGLPGNWTARVTNRGRVRADVSLQAAFPGTTPIPDRFPDTFLWGAATAAYQAEGNITNNDWDFFASDSNIA